MCKAAYIIRKGNKDSHQPDVYLNKDEALTILALFFHHHTKEFEEALGVPYDTIRTRIQRLYEKCGIELLKDKKKHFRWQLKKWALDVRLVIVLNGTYCLSSYHVNGEGRQLELPFTY